MADQDDVLQLIEDDVRPPQTGSERKWKIAVIDDDAAVHEGTRFALSDYSLNGQTLEILSAYSAAEGRALMSAHDDIAAVLLDVIMETDAAGLELVEYIRNELKNETVRIILRTGQPGQAPERRVIVDYDINDYKAKTELTADKLFTSLTAALRSYQQLERMVQTRRGLEIIIDAASTLYDFKSMQRLAEGVLTQIASLLNVDCAGILVLRDSRDIDKAFSVLAGSGCYSKFLATNGGQPLDSELQALVQSAFERRKHEFVDHRSVLYIKTASDREVVVLLEAAKDLSDTDRSLVEIFGSRLSVAFDNVILYQQLQEANTQLEDRVAQRTKALDGGEPAAVGAMAAPAARQRVQERDARHRRPRPEEPARRHPRPHRDAEGTGRRRDGLEGRRNRPGRPHPRCHQAPDLDGRPADLGCDGRCLRHHDPARGGRHLGAGAGNRGGEPAVGGEQAADHHRVGLAGAGDDVRRRPHARGDRQPRQQRDQILGGRRQDRAQRRRAATASC